LSTNVLILGVNGQDGTLLSHILSRENYTIYGLGHNSKQSQYLPSNLRYLAQDIRDAEKISQLIQEYSISQVYNLSGFSSVAESLTNPTKALEINFKAVQNLLRQIYSNSKGQSIRFFQASSSEMLGPINARPHNEYSSLNPKSPYAESKALAHLETEKYRQSGFFVTCGILFNHESILRPQKYLSRKVSSGIAAIKLGMQEKIGVGNLNLVRDWGAAEEYVQAIKLIMEADEPSSFIVSTNSGHTVKELICCTLEAADLNAPFESYVSTKEDLLRPNELSATIGDSSKIEKELNWTAQISLKEIMHKMFLQDLSILKSGSAPKTNPSILGTFLGEIGK